MPEDSVGSEVDKQLEEFRRQYLMELDLLLEMGFYDDEPLPPDPSSMGIGETNLEELSPLELAIVRLSLYSRLGIDQESVHRQYYSEAPEEATVPGRIDVKVFRTNTPGKFLQEMTFLDGQQRWVIGPDVNV